MSAQHFIAIHPIVVKLFQSGPNKQPNSPTHASTTTTGPFSIQNATVTVLYVRLVLFITPIIPHQHF